MSAATAPATQNCVTTRLVGKAPPQKKVGPLLLQPGSTYYCFHQARCCTQFRALQMQDWRCAAQGIMTAKRNYHCREGTSIIIHMLQWLLTILTNATFEMKRIALCQWVVGQSHPCIINTAAALPESTFCRPITLWVM